MFGPTQATAERRAATSDAHLKTGRPRLVISLKFRIVLAFDLPGCCEDDDEDEKEASARSCEMS